MRWAEFRGPGLANRLQTAIFGDLSGICKTRTQQQQTVAAGFGTSLLKIAMTHLVVRIRMKKQPAAMNLRSHSIDKLNHYDRRIRQIVKTGAHTDTLPQHAGPDAGPDENEDNGRSPSPSSAPL
eukprot:COSAG01_NODE_179_length_22923_cov_25.190535_31_plen_124_part_00